MKVINKKLECAVCGKEIIVSIGSWGTMHQNVESFVCEDCYDKQLEELKKSEEISKEEFEEMRDFIKGDEKSMTREVELPAIEPEGKSKSIEEKSIEEIKRDLKASSERIRKYLEGEGEENE